MSQFYERKRMGTFSMMAISLLMSMMVLSGGEPALKYSIDDQRLVWGPCPTFIPKGCEIVVLHGDMGDENADIFFKVPADFKIPHHWHTSPERMVLISGTMKVTYDDQKTETLHAGDYAYGPAKRPHFAYCEKGTPCVLFIAFENPVDAFEVIQKLPFK
jgi:quercetin dioxygenase-like cupin family protein